MWHMQAAALWVHARHHCDSCGTSTIHKFLRWSTTWFEPARCPVLLGKRMMCHIAGSSANIGVVDHRAMAKIWLARLLHPELGDHNIHTRTAKMSSVNRSHSSQTKPASVSHPEFSCGDVCCTMLRTILELFKEGHFQKLQHAARFMGPAWQARAAKTTNTFQGQHGGLKRVDLQDFGWAWWSGKKRVLSLTSKICDMGMRRQEKEMQFENVHHDSVSLEALFFGNNWTLSWACQNWANEFILTWQTCDSMPGIDFFSVDTHSVTEVWHPTWPLQG